MKARTKKKLFVFLVVGLALLMILLLGAPRRAHAVTEEEAREQRHSDSRGREERECQDGQMELPNKANRKKHEQDRMRSRGFLHPDAFFLCSSQSVAVLC